MKKFLPIVLLGFGIFCFVLGMILTATSSRGKINAKNCNTEISDNRNGSGDECIAADQNANICYNGKVYISNDGTKLCKRKYTDLTAVLNILGFVSLIAGFICIIIRP